MLCTLSYRFHIKYSINNAWEGFQKKKKNGVSDMVWICLISTEAGWLIGKLCSVVIALITPYMELRRVASPIAVFVVCPCATTRTRTHCIGIYRAVFDATLLPLCVPTKAVHQKYINVIWLHIDNNWTELRVMLCRYCINGANL